MMTVSLSRRLSALLILICLSSASVHAQDLFSKQTVLSVEGNVRTLYYESSQDINVSGNTIERMIVAIHGAGRTNVTFERLRDAAIANGVENETFIFAPQLLIDDDIAAQSLGPEVLFWPNGWRQGHLSTDNGRGRISSFELTNRIVEQVATNNPNISDVVILGHSAGGQYAQRFAAISQLEQDLAGIVSGIRVRYVPSNSSSVVYMDNKRPLAGTVDTFEVPDSAACPDYDDYKHGLGGNLNSFAASVGVDQIRAQYPGRDVRFLAGGDDNDPNSSSLSTTCESNLQGAQRLERATAFYNYIRDYFGEGVQDTHVMGVSPGIGHTSSIFTTDCGLSFVFDMGTCSFVTPTHLAASVDATSGDVSLVWQDRSGGEDGYQVHRSLDAGASFTLLTALPADTTTYIDDTAMASAQYRYRVRTRKGDDSSAFSSVVIANSGSAAPGNPAPPAPPPVTPPANTGGGGGASGILLLVFMMLGLLGRRGCLRPR